MTISTRNLQLYLQRHGWQMRREALQERGLYWFEHPTLRPRQITFIEDEEAPDYEISLMLALEKLAEVQQMTTNALLDSIQDADDDTIFFRLFGRGVDSERLPFSFVTEVLSGCRDLLLATAHSVLAPRLYHPRLGRPEALEFLDSTGFGQTAPGSFVFKVTCPVPETLFSLGEGYSPPFAREVTLALNMGLRELSTALRTDALANLIETQRQTQMPVLSANFCDALTRFRDEKLANSLDVSLLWALTTDAPQHQGGSDVIRFKSDDFKRIDEVRDVLRSTERIKEDLFFATVESLNGVMGNDGRRFGQVVFRVVSAPEEKPVRARAELSPDDYAKADRAHMSDHAYALFNARLHPGRQPRILTDLDEIEWYLGEEPNLDS